MKKIAFLIIALAAAPAFSFAACPGGQCPSNNASQQTYQYEQQPQKTYQYEQQPQQTYQYQQQPQQSYQYQHSQQYDTQPRANSLSYNGQTYYYTKEGQPYYYGTTYSNGYGPYPRSQNRSRDDNIDREIPEYDMTWGHRNRHFYYNDQPTRNYRR